MAGDEPAITRAIAAARPLASRFHEAGHTLFLVGGVVRDQVLDRDDVQPDLDCTTDARPDQILEVVGDIADRTWTHGEQFGTIGCRIESQIFEITTHRADAYEPNSRKPVVAFGDSVEDDLARRDFTVNAMAIDLADGRFVDPFGGRADLVAGVLRTPLEPEISFAEDPLRMLRAARFIAGHHLRPTPDLTAAVTAMVGRIDIVSIERIRDEFDVLLGLDEPGAGFEFLVTTGLWSRLFPELDPATAETLGRRVSAVDVAPGERWAALVSTGDRGVLDRLRLPKAIQAEVNWLLAVMTRVMHDSPASDRELRDLGKAVPDDERLERAIEFIASLVAADGGEEGPINDLRSRVADLRSREPDFDHPQLPLGGDDVMKLLGLEPGPEVGRAIEQLRRHRVEYGPFTAEEAARLLTGA